ncbi:class I SAM-dependent methyltransferase [Antrihabitans stalactiti]|uniref:Class I SAM-dependent methyltransferase n=1 Tax=Antrihabitans stalactiti TaxID=2584121 RepID=A0A848KK65_9NOCA|nr:class I SAM-dependent methyltransferase [Antrihabitans stalactiti]
MGKVDGTALSGVPETALWTLRNRAVEAARSDSTYDDPQAVAVYEAIDFPYEKFGKHSQNFALRALTFDRVVRDFLERNPTGTVVALGEGLQTSFWRINHPAMHWISVDLPPLVALREKLLPADPRLTHVAASALDRSWMRHAPIGSPVMVTAEGLFMYLPPADVLALIADIAARFPGGQLLFDNISQAISAKSLEGRAPVKGAEYTTPPMPFHLSIDEARALPERIPGIASVVDVDVALGRGLWGAKAVRALLSLPRIRNRRPSITLLEFAAD